MKCVLRASIVLGAVAILMAGCNGPGVDMAKVTGKVTVAGAPMADVTVTFVPEAGGRPATGITDSGGNFTLATFSQGDGAIPGKHKVAFAVNTSAPPSNLPGDIAAPAAAPFNAKYLNADTSGITKEVKAGEANHFDFDLDK